MAQSRSSFNFVNFKQQFFERLRFFEEETERKRIELKETLDQETKDIYEKKLAGQHKISDKMDEDAMDPLLGEESASFLERDLVGERGGSSFSVFAFHLLSSFLDQALYSEAN